MFAKMLNLRLKEFGIHYGWIMAVMAFLTTISSSAAVSTPQVLIIPLTESFGWNISDVTSLTPKTENTEIESKEIKKIEQKNLAQHKIRRFKR